MKYRSPLMVFVLSLITLGIYGIYWLYATRKEILQIHGDQKAIPPVLVLFAPILGIIAILFAYSIINYFSDGVSSSSVVNVLLFVFTAVIVIAAIVVPFIWFYRYSKTVDIISNNKNSLFLYYVLLAIFGGGPIWYAIAQSTLNMYGSLHSAALKAGVANNINPTQL